MTSTILSQKDLAAMVDDLVASGARVIAPVHKDDARRAEYRPVNRLDEAALDGALPRRSLKEFFLPASEVLLRYRQKKDGVELTEVPTSFPAQVILGARPCDAAGVATLDKVMGWDYRDELWFGRREATTIVTLACPGQDSSCFCSAVGLGPDSTKGADAVLVPIDGQSAQGAGARRQAGPLGDEVERFLQSAEPFPDVDRSRAPAPTRYVARALTAKGEALLSGRGSAFQAEDGRGAEAFVESARQRVARSLAPYGGTPPPGEPSPGLSRLPTWLARNFDHPLWKSIALRCHGCGACAAVCSTCHCFDIVDEHDTYDRGARRRNWDSCQTSKFTIHASGHNPRSTQTERYRQRVMHKFSTYPNRFGEILCTGCGRCARACGAGMNLPQVLGQLTKLAEAETAGSAR